MAHNKSNGNDVLDFCSLLVLQHRVNSHVDMAYNWCCMCVIVIKRSKVCCCRSYIESLNVLHYIPHTGIHMLMLLYMHARVFVVLFARFFGTQWLLSKYTYKKRKKKKKRKSEKERSTKGTAHCAGRKDSIADKPIPGDSLRAHRANNLYHCVKWYKINTQHLS